MLLAGVVGGVGLSGCGSDPAPSGSFLLGRGARSGCASSEWYEDGPFGERRWVHQGAYWSEPWQVWPERTGPSHFTFSVTVCPSEYQWVLVSDGGMHREPVLEDPPGTFHFWWPYEPVDKWGQPVGQPMFRSNLPASDPRPYAGDYLQLKISIPQHPPRR